MCGIVGYVGHRRAGPLLLASLRRLEYRGYDSCGLAVGNGAISVFKAVGRVDDLAKLVKQDDSTAGIGHTRWATHGGVTVANAHPHTDCRGNIAVVHNGVIENYNELRCMLEATGHTFRSETDTEVIPHLIEASYARNMAEAVSAALAQLHGSYAIIVLSSATRTLFAARKDCPLVIGVGDRENLVVSDVSAVLDYADRAIYLEDGDFCAITESAVAIKNSGKEVSRRISPVPWTVEQVQKGGYDHFMLKEIHEQ
ncbi:MAG: glutamine--fructose-6-phosphate aminotransferase, partial [Chloroflexi bacterium]|nr:glutamine--fructose-6-phosphate aminotransferase [Chloroflexota bacterium]